MSESYMVLQLFLHTREVGKVPRGNLMFPLNVGEDVSETVDEFLLARVFAKHRRHFLPEVTDHVCMDLQSNTTTNSCIPHRANRQIARF